MDKIVETYNPYNQNVERKSSQLPWYINETFINSVEIRSPFIAGNKWYIGWTLQVWQDWIVIDGNAKTIKSTNFIDNVSWWIINWNGDAKFNNITARWTFILSWWETVEEAIESIQDPTWDNLQSKPNVLQNAAINTPTPYWTWFQLTATHMWYYSWWAWKTYMQSNGNFWLSGSWSNYLTWNWSILKVRWDIEASSISSNAIITNTIRWWKTSYSDSTAWYWLWLDWTTPKFNLWNDTNSLNWNWTQLNIKWNITAWNISWVDISWSRLTSISNNSFTTLLIDWWFIKLSEAQQYWKTILDPNWIKLLSDVWTDRELLSIRHGLFNSWRYKTARIKFAYDWLEDTWWTISYGNNWIIIQSDFDLTSLDIQNNRIWFWWVNVVWTWSRTIAWYMEVEINSNTYYIPYYN